MRNSALSAQVYSNLQPDFWNARWSQVERFGGGMAVEVEVGEFLYALVRATKPTTVVETGTHRGFSTLMIAQALQENGGGHLYTVDLVDHGVVQECEEFGLAEQVTFHAGDSAAYIGELAKDIDLLWLDADHDTEPILRELNAASRWLGDGALVAFHDVLVDPREAEAIKRIRESFPAWECLNLTTARGFTLMRVVAERRER